VLLVLFGFVEVVLVLELVESVELPLASIDLWCFLCFLVVVVLPFASVELVVLAVLVELCAVSFPLLELDCDWASLCGMELCELCISLSLLAESLSELVAAGFAGAWFCAIRCGVVDELSALGVDVSD
jgi:hypothetical protein